MKKLILISITFFIIACLNLAAHTPDTTIIYQNKKILIKDSVNSTKISVYNLDKGSKLSKVYEGIYSEDKEIERSYISSGFQKLPLINVNKKRKPSATTHWRGIGVGFIRTPTTNFDFNNDFDFVLNKENSLQYNINALPYVFLNRNRPIGFITGFGFQFNYIRFYDDYAVRIEDNMAKLSQIEGLKYKKSRLYVSYLTIPLLVEFNKKLASRTPIWVNFGLELKVIMASNSKIWLYNGSKKAQVYGRNLYLNPINADFVVNAGISNFGIFAKYSPISMFQSNRGKQVSMAVFGFQFYF